VILTTGIVVRLALLVILTALAQVTCFSKMVIFGTSPDVALLVVASLGLLGGSVTGAVSGFSIGLLIDSLLLQTLGAFALAMLAVGYVAGRYRENVGRPTRGAVPLLGGLLTLLGVGAFAAIQIGTGVDADVSTLVIRDALIKSLFGAALAVPVLAGVRLLLRPALIEDRRTARRPMTSAPAESARS
jgi:rod shape-determining protein MreD